MIPVRSFLQTGATKSRLRASWARILGSFNKIRPTFQSKMHFLPRGVTQSQLLISRPQPRNTVPFSRLSKYSMHVTLEEMTQEPLATKKAKAEDDAGASKSLELFALLRADVHLPDQLEAIAKACENHSWRYPMGVRTFGKAASVQAGRRRSSGQVPTSLAATVRADPVLRTRIFQLEGELGYLQAVMHEDMLQNTSNTDLTQCLEQDASQPMKLGDRFFRYTIVTDNDDSGNDRRHFVWIVYHALCDAASLLTVLGEVSTRFHNEPTVQRRPFDQYIESTITANPSQE
ncbi:hypothetical protein BBP40_002892 [Aspergillus hancockii]|nr:hypothetical protein BBP40_002892 [Aspergillus hancockii]